MEDMEDMVDMEDMEDVLVVELYQWVDVESDSKKQQEVRHHQVNHSFFLLLYQRFIETNTEAQF